MASTSPSSPSPHELHNFPVLIPALEAPLITPAPCPTHDPLARSNEGGPSPSTIRPGSPTQPTLHSVPPAAASATAARAPTWGPILDPGDLGLRFAWCTKRPSTAYPTPADGDQRVASSGTSGYRWGRLSAHTLSHLCPLGNADPLKMRCHRRGPTLQRLQGSPMPQGGHSLPETNSFLYQRLTAFQTTPSSRAHLCFPLMTTRARLIPFLHSRLPNT